MRGKRGREASLSHSPLHGGSGMVISGFDVTTPTPEFLLNVFSEIVKKVNLQDYGAMPSHLMESDFYLPNFQSYERVSEKILYIKL